MKTVNIIYENDTRISNGDLYVRSLSKFSSNRLAHKLGFRNKCLVFVLLNFINVPECAVICV